MSVTDSTITLCGQTIGRILYRNEPVINFVTVDNLHGRKVKTSHKQFYRNKKSFIEGLDYYMVPYNEWKKLLDTPFFQGDVFMKWSFFDLFKDEKRGGRRGPIYFLTKTGYIKLTDFFNDPRAKDLTAMFERLYFLQ